MTATLLRNLFELLTQGLINPRATVRRIIDEEPSLADRLLLVGLAAAMQGALWALTSVLVQGIGGGIGFGGQIRLAFQVFINYVITATLAYNIGIRFGGKGTVPQVATKGNTRCNSRVLTCSTRLFKTTPSRTMQSSSREAIAAMR